MSTIDVLDVPDGHGLTPRARQRLEVKDRLWAAVKAAGGRAELLVAQIGDMTLLMDDDHLIRVVSARRLEVSQYPLRDVEVLERMIRRHLAFERVRAAGGEFDWSKHP